jgi:hypothetical protein
MVLTTPDANRTMLSYLGTPAPAVLDARLEAAIAHSRLLVIEGYVWEMPDAVASISAALEVCGCCWKRTCHSVLFHVQGMSAGTVGVPGVSSHLSTRTP